jgi:hypothetical protein
MTIRPINPQHFDQLHRLIGLALWHTEAFEDCLARFIALILKMPASRVEAEAMAVLEALESRTIGQLIVELRKANSTNSVTEFERRINHFLAERNWLVHQSWRQHHTDLYQPQKLPPLFARLTNIADEATVLQRHFADLSRTWTLQQGHTEAEMKAETKKVLRARGVIE